MENKKEAIAIFVINKIWHDKINGNNYRATKIIIHFSDRTKDEILIPFFYGGNISFSYINEILNEKNIFISDRNNVEIINVPDCKKMNVRLFGEIGW